RKAVFVKDDRGIVVIEILSWAVIQEFRFPSNHGGSPHGILLNRNGSVLWASTADNQIIEMAVGPDRKLSLVREITIPGPGGAGKSHPCGLALSSDEKT